MIHVFTLFDILEAALKERSDIKVTNSGQNLYITPHAPEANVTISVSMRKGPDKSHIGFTEDGEVVIRDGRELNVNKFSTCQDDPPDKVAAAHDFVSRIIETVTHLIPKDHTIITSLGGPPERDAQRIERAKELSRLQGVPILPIKRLSKWSYDCSRVSEAHIPLSFLDVERLDWIDRHPHTD